MDIKKLAIGHPYYCSESNYYSNDASVAFDTMTEFLDVFGDSDVDMNLCFRWDVRDKTDLGGEEKEEGKYYAEIFIMGQRKGKFIPIFVESFEQHEVERFLEYANKHLDTLKKMWEPLS